MNSDYKPKISIVIPNFILDNTTEELAERTIAFFKRTTKDYELILVDDGSWQGSKMLEEQADVYIRHPKNKGYAPSMNDGWRVAKGDYIVTANNDIEVYPNWFEKFEKWINLLGEKRFKVGVIGGTGFRTRMIEGVPIEEHKGDSNKCSIGGQYKDWMMPGGFFMMKRELLDKIGYFDEKFLHGGYEDIDYFYRIRQADYKLVIIPEVHYWHKEGATRWAESQILKFKGIEKHNLEYFIEKWGFNPHQEMSRIFKIEEINL